MLLVNDCESTKFEQSSFSMHYSIKKMQVEEQTVQALIRLLLQEQSDLGLHCLLRPICPNILNFYSENINCLCFKGITIFYLQFISIFIFFFGGGGGGGSDAAKVLGKLSVPGHPTILDYSRARAYCACTRCRWGVFGHFSLVYHFSPLSPSLWETARYRLKYCLKGLLSLKQPTNQPIFIFFFLTV